MEHYYEMDVGQELLLERPSNISTGYTYTVMLQDGLKMVNNKYTSSEREKMGATGAGGTQKWAIRAEREGTFYISLLHWRPWETFRQGDIELIKVEVSLPRTARALPQGPNLHSKEKEVGEDRSKRLALVKSGSKIVGYKMDGHYYKRDGTAALNLDGNMFADIKVIPSKEGETLLDIYLLQGDVVYIKVGVRFPDQIYCLYNHDGKRLGCPRGGLSGKGDRSFPSFDKESKFIGTVKIA